MSWLTLSSSEAAGYCPPAAGDLLLHQSGGEGKVFVFSGKAVKGSSGPIQPNRGVGIVVLGGQVDQPRENQVPDRVSRIWMARSSMTEPSFVSFLALSYQNSSKFR